MVKMKFLIIIMSFFTIAITNQRSIAQTEQPDYNEVQIFNSLLDSLYSVHYCYSGPLSPKMKFFNRDTNNDQYVQYKIEYEEAKKLFQARLDKLSQVVIVMDTLTTIDFPKHRDFLLKCFVARNDSVLYDFIEDIPNSILKRPFNTDSLKQGDVKFMPSKYFKKKVLSDQLGIHGKEFFIGIMEFSRIYFDRNKNIGVFSYVYYGKSGCGYVRYIFIKYSDKGWRIYDTVQIGAW
jgi:hypothetical protein